MIKVENTNYRPLPKGVSSKLKVGELVMAIGSPYRLDQSVTTGIVSATDRNDLGINDVDAYESFIQTDAAINPGNSGGPLVNMDGQVIGINSAIVTGGRGNDGVGFAIPIDLASTIADNLIKHGKVRRSRVGIALEPLTPAFARELGLDAKIKGVVASQIVPGSPAEKAGLKPGDVMTCVQQQPDRQPADVPPDGRVDGIGHGRRRDLLARGEVAHHDDRSRACREVVFDRRRNARRSPRTRSRSRRKPTRSRLPASGSRSNR